MKRHSKDRTLAIDRIFHILTEEKAEQEEKVQIPMRKFEDYFPGGTSKKEVEAVIFMLLDNFFQSSKEA